MLWVGYGLYVAVCWTLGLFALRAARRSGSLVEWAVAAVALAGGGVGCPLLFVSTLVSLAPAQRAILVPAGVLGLAAASVALYFSVWRAFRPQSVLAPLLCTAGTFAIGWSILAIVFTQGYAWPRDPRWLALQSVALWLPYPWAGLEMFLHAFRLRGRPAAAGEAPARSFFCYGVALAAMALAFLPVVASAVRTRGAPYPRLVLISVGVAGLTAALAAALGLYDAATRVGLSPDRGAAGRSPAGSR